jgi:hypothetical protein
MTTLRRNCSLLVLLLLLILPIADAFRRSKSGNATKDALLLEHGQEEDMPHVHYLVEMIGKELYAAVNTRKYRFYIYMTVGTMPDERSTILLISTVCNLLYCSSIFLGFMFFRRGPMIIFTLATLWIGPALVLILLGTIGLAIAAFALYPIASVPGMTLWFFLTSQLAQTLGKKFGLDSDGDGDVDWLDLLHAVGKTEVGRSMGIKKLYDFLNQCKFDPFKEIHRRLDRIQISTSELSNNSRQRLSFSERSSPEKDELQSDRKVTKVL